MLCKSCSVNTPYKAVAVRAFYFELGLDPYLSFSVAKQLKLVCCDLKNFPDDFEMNHHMIDSQRNHITFELACFFDKKLYNDLEYDVDWYHDRLSNDLKIDRDFFPGYVKLPQWDYKASYYMEDSLFNSLGELVNKNPFSYHGGWDMSPEEIKDWKDNKASVWKENLKKFMIEHRNIGINFDFSAREENILEAYYQINKLLAYCLYFNWCVDIRQEFESMLLLPL